MKINRFFFTKSDLESRGLLNPSSNVDIFCLHTVCWHLLSTTVDNFVIGWNNHPISTAENFSPLQLFHLGLTKLKNMGGEHPELNQVI